MCKEMRACTHKHGNFGSAVIILEENLVQIGVIITEILLLMKCDNRFSRSALYDAFSTPF